MSGKVEFGCCVVGWTGKHETSGRGTARWVKWGWVDGVMVGWECEGQLGLWWVVTWAGQNETEG